MRLAVKGTYVHLYNFRECRKMNQLRWAVIAPAVAAIVCLGGAGMAQDRDDGFYASVSGLVVSPDDASWTDPDVSVDIDMKTGFGFLAAVGRSLSSGLRAELELGYREYDFGRAGVVEFDGQFSTISLMVNGIYSFGLGRFRPYAGIGVGLARHRAEIDSVAVPGSSFLVEDAGEADVFAYQGMAGIGYAVSDRTEISLGYRYFSTAEGDFGADIEITSANHQFEAGMLFRF